MNELHYFQLIERVGFRKDELLTKVRNSLKSTFYQIQHCKIPLGS